MATSRDWRCPHCGEINSKTSRQGPVLKHLPSGEVLFEVSQPDNCPRCGGAVSGGDILTGKYDYMSSAEILGPLVGILSIVWLLAGGGFVLYAFENWSSTAGIICAVI